MHHTSLGLPSGCTRTGDEVTCMHLLSFPRPFISNATTVTITTSKFAEIPSGSFEGLTNLKNLTITTVDIGIIRACAFASLANIDVINIETSKITTIESDAFINITGTAGGKMSFYTVSLDTIRPYAFSNIDGFDHFSIDLATIRSIQSYAFYNVNPRRSVAVHRVNITEIGAGAFQMMNQPSVDFYSSTIYKLGCETYDKLYTDLGSKFHLHSVNITCDCNLAWFVTAVNNTPAIVGNDVKCFEPAALADVKITDVTIQQLCNQATPSTCDSNKMAAPTDRDVCRTSGSTNDVISLCVLASYLLNTIWHIL